MFGRLVFWPTFSSYFFTFFRTIFLALASTGSFVISKSKIPAKAKTIAVKTTVPPNSTSLPRPAKKADVAFLTRVAGIAAITERTAIFIEYKIVPPTTAFTSICLFFLRKTNSKMEFARLPRVSARAIPPPLIGFIKISAKIIFIASPRIPARVGDFVFPCA